MQPQTIADINPNGTKQAIGPAGKKAVWIQFSAPSGNGADCRVGDVNVGASRGAVIAKGTSVLFPRCEFAQGGYDLGTVYVYGGSGADVVGITYGD